MPSKFITNPLSIEKKVDRLSSETFTNETINDRCEYILFDVENTVEGKYKSI